MDGRTRNGLAVALIVVIALTGVAAFLASRAAERTELSVTGVVAGIESEGLDRVRSFSVRTDTGQVVQLEFGIVQNAAEFPPGHLAEHQATGQPVRVVYLQQGESKVAIRIDDAS
jgi:phosphoribosylcarboxyaminoimidazole (NCAIR) mutase